jgi:rRNA-processing protein FCF1
MPTKKPTTSLRRARKATTPREQNEALERVARKHQRPQNDVEERAALGVVRRAGRTYANGRSATPAGEVRRLTVYIPLAVFDELEARARSSRDSLSTTASIVLAEAFGVAVQAAG